MLRPVALILALLPLSCLAAQTPPEPVRHPNMGVQTHFGHGGPVTTDSERHTIWNIERSIEKAAELGVGWIRDDLFWNQYETERGKYQVPPRAMEWIDAANAAGLKIIVIFNTDRNNRQNLYANPFDPDAYARAAAQLVQDLKGKIHAIEIINEPHNFGFMPHYGGNWNGWDAQTGEESPWIAKYVQLLNKSAAAIREVDQDIPIIGLGSPAPANFRKIAHGIHPGVTGVTDHPYGFRMPAELVPFSSHQAFMERDGVLTAGPDASFASQVRAYRDHLAQHNGPQQIWFTEWGFPTHLEAEAKQFAGYTEEAQAKYTQRRFVESLGLGVEMSIYYDLKNDGSNRYDAEHNFGLLTLDFEPKPAFGAVRRVAETMQGWQPTRSAPGDLVSITIADKRPAQRAFRWDGGPIIPSTDALFYTFTPEADAGAQNALMVVFWSPEYAGGDYQPRVGDITVQLQAGKPLPTQARFRDLWTGQSTTKQINAADAASGSVTFKNVDIPDAPVALILE